MKKLNQLLVVALLVMLVIIAGCSDDDSGPSGKYVSGVLVVNEGNFNDADGTISYYNPLTETIETNIFSRANNEAALGDVVQSVTIHGDYAYIIVNNSNKVEVVNSNTMESITSFESMMPRYMAIANGKGYLTEWDADWSTFIHDSKVLVIDLLTHSVTSTIKTGSGAEQIVLANGKLYVSDSFSNTITVIDPNTDEVVSTITTDFYSISGLVADGNDNVWGVYSGSTDWSVTPAVPANDGALVRVNTSDDIVDLVVSLNINISSKMAMNNSGSKLYCYSGTDVYIIDIAGSSPTVSKIISEASAISFYGIGVDPSNGDIYLADSKAFQGNGTGYRFSADGTKIGTFDTGRGPNGFIFK